MKTKTFQLLALCASLAAASIEAQPSFTKITNGYIVNDIGGFASFAWGDFSKSGFLDLVVCNNGNLGGTGGTNVFYRNNGDGTFTKVTLGDPVADADYHVSAVAGDFDNDGNLDLAVTSGVNSPTARRNFLYRNNGDGSFTRAGGSALTNALGYFGLCSWVDYDNDGFLDLCAAENSSGTILLFRNQGDGTFKRITSGSVVTDVSYGSAVWADYDNDGFDDLLVITGENNGENLLYHNNKNGTFTRVLTNSIATDRWSAGTYGSAWGDYDNDGLLDLFVTCPAGTPNRLYHNNGDGTFTSIATGPTASRPAGADSEACAWGDYDNDGYLDLFVTSSHGANMLFHNNGDGTFSQILNVTPAQETNSGFYCNACTWVDYDNDGFLDLFATRAPAASNLLYHNDGNSNGWIELKLVGTVGNRSAYGTKVRLHATIGGKSFWQMREITSGGGRWNPPLTVHFGLGGATNVDTMRIEWPSGAVQEFKNVASRQFITIIEPANLSAIKTNGSPQFILKGGRNLAYEIDSSADLQSWSSLATETITNLSGTATLSDTNAPSSDRRFYRAVLRQ
jgi:hypothetical protein